MKYCATVILEFDDQDLEELASYLGVTVERLESDLVATVNGTLDNLELGTGRVVDLTRVREPN